jgi:periplasmic divalent cation tolerance protein
MSQNLSLNPDKLMVVVTSLPNMEAAAVLAKALIESHLAACVQMNEGMYSVYRWEGKLCEEQEIVLSAKTMSHQWEEICTFIKEIHPYDIPEILAFSPEQYDKQYAQWVSSEVNSKT